MMLRIIHGKLKPGTWESYERAYKEVTAKAGKIPGLKGRWLAHAVDDPDAGYTMSLWADEAAMRAYESSEVLQQTILPHLKPFFGRLHYNAVRGSVCGRVRVIARAKGLLSLAFEEVCDPAGQFLSGVFRYVDGIATSARTIVTFWRTHRDLKRSDNCATAALNGVGVNF